MNEIADDEKMLTMHEALAYLHIGRTTMYRFLGSGKIKGHKVGSVWRFYLGELRRFVKSAKG